MLMEPTQHCLDGIHDIIVNSNRRVNTNDEVLRSPRWRNKRLGIKNVMASPTSGKGRVQVVKMVLLSKTDVFYQGF